MSVPTIRINPRVKAAAARADYMRAGFVQIPDIFEPDVAEHIATMLETLPYDLAFEGEDGRPVVLKPDQTASDADAVAQRTADMIRRSGNGYGFIYRVYPLIIAYLEQRDPGHPIHRLTEFLNAEFVAFGAFVTNQPAVAKADGQLTRYGPGDFIGLHNDVGSEDSDRLTAYTLGFTRDWRPDWGGQLLFHDENGDVTCGYIPRFNTLTLFSVPQMHSVAPVAPYAQRPRHSVVGWLRNHQGR
ncbi:hypothetical protein OB03_06410 [Brevundimonas sp. GN22]